MPEAGRVAGAGDAAFRAELVRVLPHLRAFARGLSGRADLADDLVQDTAIRAWAARERFAAGTNLRAWTFTIMRNHFLNERRKRSREADFDEAVAERVLVEPASQESSVHLSDLERALRQLPPEQREALLLVGAGRFSYEEAGAICAVAEGTMKSRVARARAALARVLESVPTDSGAPRRGRGRPRKQAT